MKSSARNSAHIAWYEKNKGLIQAKARARHQERKNDSAYENRVLGFIEDSPELLMAMAAYLKRTAANTSPQLTLPGV